MTTQPDPNRHEASRPAFEAAYINRPNLLIRRQFGQLNGYRDGETHLAWETWMAALDWRDSQTHQDTCPTCGASNWQQRLKK